MDATGGVDDPRGMVCDTAGARLHVLDAASHALFNLGQCLHRCELEVEEMVSSFASGLATLVDDEREWARSPRRHGQQLPASLAFARRLRLILRPSTWAAGRSP